MKILDFFKNPFKKKVVTKVTDEQKEAFAKIILNKKKQQEGKPNKKYKTIETYEIGGITFKIGDKVICRSNEPHPLLVGKIIEFWDNGGKWETAVPIVRNFRNGKRITAHGVVKPYSNDLMDSLRKLKPLEQWNTFVPEEVRYTSDEMEKKEKLFKAKVLPKKK
jgi:hypothetical protein